MIDLLNERKQIIINSAVTKGLNPNAKMKDSGVEWIGEVPEGWEVKKLGYCIDILPGYAFPSQDFVENGIKLLRGINVSPEKIRWEESVYWNKTIDDTLKKYLLEENDLVLGLDRPWIGSGTRVAIVKKEDLPCLLVQRVCRIRPTNMMSINYIYYLLSNNLFYNALAVDTTGVSVPHISTEQIKKVVIPIPKLSEQNAIVEYIEMHIASINKAIQAANNQISLLQERKQIIINEVVTGKVKVG
jgi:type I restriction enzyme S subunit